MIDTFRTVWKKLTTDYKVLLEEMTENRNTWRDQYDALFARHNLFSKEAHSSLGKQSAEIASLKSHVETQQRTIQRLRKKTPDIKCDGYEPVYDVKPSKKKKKK